MIAKTEIIDELINEWSYRLKDGLPDMTDPDKVSVLKQIIAEGNYGELDEAPGASVKVDEWHKIFTPDYINTIYPKHGKEIMDIFKKYVPNPKKVAGDKLNVLHLFGTISSVAKLVSVISSNVDNTFFQDLFNVSSVSGQAGGAEEKSGRGGLGKGEVLCVLLTKGGKSGGTSGTDLDGSIQAEIKSNNVKEFKIPLAASRVTRLIAQSELRKIYSWISNVSTTKLYKDFVAEVQDTLSGDAKMKEQKDGTFFRGESVTEINQTEFSNISKFFKGCHEVFYGEKKKGEDDDVYVDMNTAGDDDVVLKAKLKTPKALKDIKPGSKVTMDVVSKSDADVSIFEKFENALKNHTFVKKPGSFDTIVNQDCLNIIKTPGFIVFLEPSRGKLGKPVFINDKTYNPRLVGFTLNQAIIKYDMV